MVTNEIGPDSESNRTYRVIAQFQGTGEALAAKSQEFQAMVAQLGGQVLQSGIIEPSDPNLTANEPARAPFITAEHPLYAALALPLGDALDTYAADQNSAMAVRIYNNLRRAGVRNLRDIFTYGKSAAMDIRNLGDQQMDTLRTLVGRVGEMTWLNTPELADVAHYCTSLAEVRAALVDRDLPDYSIQEFLDADIKTLMRELPSRHTYVKERKPRTLYPADYLPDIITKIEAYAEAFTAARTQLELQHAVPPEA